MLNKFVGEEIEKEKEQDNSEEESCSVSSDEAKKKVTDKTIPPVVICIDNAHDMCPTSWEFLKFIMNGHDHLNIAIILLVKTDYRDRMIIHNNSLAAF